MIFTSNDIGDIGETTFDWVMSRHNLFRTCMLGSKWPIVDFYVELKQANGMFFFVQVKSTRESYDTESKKLNVSCTDAELDRLRKYCAPTFLAAVDITNERVYLKSISKSPHGGVSDVKELDEANIKLLHEDVRAFWVSSSLEAHKSTFKHQL